MTQFIKICMTQFYRVLNIKMTQFIKMYVTKKYIIIIYDYF